MTICTHTMCCTHQHRERHTDHSHTNSTGSNGLILLPSLAEQDGGLLVGICICAYIQCVCPHSWAYMPSPPSSCSWSWTYKSLRPQPCSSCWHKCPQTCTHAHMKSSLGLPWSPVTTHHCNPCGLTLRDIFTPGLPDHLTSSLAHLA